MGHHDAEFGPSTRLRPPTLPMACPGAHRRATRGRAAGDDRRARGQGAGDSLALLAAGHRGGARQDEGFDIWCAGTVVQIANGTTDKASPRCKNILHAGAVCIKWPADKDFDEGESYTWSLLTIENWNKEAVLGWRYTAAQLAKLGETRTPAGKRQK